MVDLSIDVEKLLPFVVDAFTTVYGDEYHDIILKKMKNAFVIQYYDIEGLDDYISFIKGCKRREYAIKFLDGIGIDIEKYKKANYLQPLDSKIEKILEYYMKSSYLGFNKNTDYWVPLQAFKSDNAENPDILLANKIKIINYLLDNGYEQITKENFDLFIETEEYHKVLEKVDELNMVYEQLLSEYREWEEKLRPYEQFVESETKRKKEILRRNKILFFMDIYSKLPLTIRKAISDKSLEEKINIILGFSDISSATFIESFGSDKMKQLKSKDVSLDDKSFIISLQANFLRNIGLDVIDKYSSYMVYLSDEDVDDYLKFLNQDNIKKYIPSSDLVSYIAISRENRYEEAIREYYMTRGDFTNIKKDFSDDDSLEYIYERVRNKSVCIDGLSVINDDNWPMSLMFYTIRTFSCGSLFHVFMHECGHIIDLNSERTGFESFNDFTYNSINNPYDECFRKYEKFNEALNDIFTIEAVELLHNQGIYLIEPQEFTLLDASEINTASITKNLLQPLLAKFRKQVTSAKIKADRSELIRYIGNDNFEELVDVVNKVDYLSRNGVTSKLDTSPEDEMVKEYFEQVERAKRIYRNIDDYYSDNVGYLMTYPKK